LQRGGFSDRCRCNHHIISFQALSAYYQQDSERIGINMKISINTLIMVMWGLNVPYYITESERFIITVNDEKIDITDYSESELRELSTNILEGAKT